MTLPPSQNITGPSGSIVGVAGAGNTVTSTVVSQFAHSSAIADIVYLITPEVLPVLFNVCMIELPQDVEQSLKPDNVPPDGGVTISAVHVKRVPIILLDIVMFVLVDGHIDWDVVFTVTVIIWLAVTVTLFVLLHPEGVVSVRVYVVVSAGLTDGFELSVSSSGSSGTEVHK